MTHETLSFSSPADNWSIAYYVWHAQAPAKGVVQIAHGLAEHAPRYERLAEALCAAGYHVYANDHRGHGASAVGSDGLGDFGLGGFASLIADVVELGRIAKSEHPSLPLFLIGHSMGSFASQSVIVDASENYAGVVLSGSTAIDVMLASMAAAGGGGDLSAFNDGFEHRTGYEWLTRDEAEVDTYVADPLCGFVIAPETMASLFAAGPRLAESDTLRTIRADLPLLLVSGSDDPLAGGGDLIELLGRRYRDAGVKDVTVVVYPGARHEVFNETNRAEVTRLVIDWLDAHI